MCLKNNVTLISELWSCRDGVGGIFRTKYVQSCPITYKIQSRTCFHLFTVVEE